jgi:glycine oxidase
VGFDRTLDESALADIQRRAAFLMPELGLQPPQDRWNGFRPGIEAEGPAIGRVPGTSIWTAFGHYRNGILLAPETARRIAALIGEG